MNQAEIKALAKRYYHFWENTSTGPRLTDNAPVELARWVHSLPQHHPRDFLPGVFQTLATGEKSISVKGFPVFQWLEWYSNLWNIGDKLLKGKHRATTTEEFRQGIINELFGQLLGAAHTFILTQLKENS